MKPITILKIALAAIFIIALAKLGATVAEQVLQPYAPAPDFMTTVFFALVVWLGIAYFVGVLGETRLIGYWPPFFVSVLFTPIVALIVILFSKRKSTHEYEQAILKSLKP